MQTEMHQMITQVEMHPTTQATILQISQVIAQLITQAITPIQVITHQMPQHEMLPIPQTEIQIPEATRQPIIQAATLPPITLATPPHLALPIETVLPIASKLATRKNTLHKTKVQIRSSVTATPFYVSANAGFFPGVIIYPVR